MPTPAYARAYLSQSVLTASPGQLVLLMYDGALRFMAQARASFALAEHTPGRIETINTALLRAQAILAELRANLDQETGGQVAQNLDRLYDYHLRRLFMANLSKDESIVAEVEALVRALRDAWAEMLANGEAKNQEAKVA